MLRDAVNVNDVSSTQNAEIHPSWLRNNRKTKKSCRLILLPLGSLGEVSPRLREVCTEYICPRWTSVFKDCNPESLSKL